MVRLVVEIPVIVVPDVVGLTYARAEGALEAVGATATRAATPHFEGMVPEGFVFDRAELDRTVWASGEKSAINALMGESRTWLVRAHSLPPGAVVAGGAEVELTVEWPSTVVPDVLGLDAAGVRAALNGAGLAAPGANGLGVARSQTIPPGTVVPMGAAVGTDISSEITFRVTSTARRGTVTWIAPSSFSIEQAVDTALPWSHSWTMASLPDRYSRGSFNAQMNAGSGSITCEIVINGEVVESRTSTGAYAIVSCG